MCACIVADSSVFILGKPLDGEVITVPSVERELLDIGSRMRFQIAEVRVEPPSKEAITKARAGAMKTGDLPSLSSTDIELLAMALERGAILATDDYALQNAASHLGVSILPVAQRGIRRTIRRKERCYGCGRPFEGDSCPVCGTPPRKRRKTR
jgi:UPF0271 protein